VVNIVYRHSGTLGALTYTGKGSKLTAVEVDENFAGIVIALSDLETQLAAGFAIMDIDVDDPLNPTMMIITLDSYETFNIPLPVATFRPRGPWGNDMGLARLDIVDVAGLGQFWVQVAHTTPSAPEEFDPEALDGEGNNLYAVFTTFAAMLHWVGEYDAGELRKVYDVFFHDDYGVFLVEEDHEMADDFDPFAEGVGPLYRWIAAKPHFPVETVSTTTYTITPLDIGKYLRFTHVDGCVITFDVDLAFPAGGKIHMRQAGDGPIIFNEGSLFTINPPRDGYDSTSQYKGATFCAVFLSQGECDLIGPHGAELVS